MHSYTDATHNGEPVMFLGNYAPLHITCFGKCSSGPEVIRLFSGSSQLSTKFTMLINVNFNIYQHAKCDIREKSVFSAVYFYEQLKFHAQLR